MAGFFQYIHQLLYLLKSHSGEVIVQTVFYALLFQAIYREQCYAHLESPYNIAYL